MPLVVVPRVDVLCVVAGIQSIILVYEIFFEIIKTKPLCSTDMLLWSKLYVKVFKLDPIMRIVISLQLFVLVQSMFQLVLMEVETVF